MRLTGSILRLRPKLSIAMGGGGGGRRILETGRILRLRPKLSIAMGEAHIASDWEHFEVASETEHCHWVMENF